MELLDKYFEIQEQIYSHFGYSEDWVVIPIYDSRECYWSLTGEGHGDRVHFSEYRESVFDGNMDDGFSNEIYTQRFLPKWVYRASDFTMICVDTCVDGNKFLQIFDNSKEIKPSMKVKDGG